MTPRSILIGLLLGLGIAVFGFFNDWVMRQPFLTTNLTPISVYGFLLVGLLVINPLLKAIRNWHLRSAEWGVIASLMLVACVVPGPGLMWYFSNALVMPHYYNRMNVGWRSQKLLQYVPDGMLVDPGRNYGRVVDDFRVGQPGNLMEPGKVPWVAWTKPLSFWLPLLALSFIAGICLVVVLHQQWSKRERLRYPVAYVTSELIRGSGQGALAAIFHERRFWLGFAIPAAILLVNGYAAWDPRSITIPLDVPLRTALGDKWPSLVRLDMSYLFLRPTVYFAAVGFAYFVSSEISFSLGVSNVAYVAMCLIMMTAGADVSGTHVEGGVQAFQMFGSYLGIGLVVFYTGRRFYLAALARGVGIPTREQVERSAVWACRIALIAAGGMVLLLVRMAGLNWLIAILFVLLAGLIFLMLTRINAETGLFMIQAGWNPVAILLGLLGFAAIGPHMMVALGILCVVMTIDPIICLMPLAANAVRVGEEQGISPPRLGRWLVVAVLVALVGGVFATIHVQYSFGTGKYTWANTVAVMPFETLERNLQRSPADPTHPQGLRLDLVRPRATFLYSAGVGLAAALALGALRLRLHWWPIHPVLLLVWGTFPMAVLAPSFFLGWLVKVGVTTFGGGEAYRRFRTFFIGLIAGEFAGAVFWMIVGLVHYIRTGIPGPVFRILPA